MRPNLSVEKIAGALAVLGASVLMAACGGEDKPAQSPDAVKATETSGAPTDKKADMPTTSPADAKPADAMPATSASTTAPATPADATKADATKTDATKDTSKTDSKTDTTTKKDPKKGATPAKKGGGASCGAGTCSAKK